MSVLVALQGQANERNTGESLAGEGGAQLPLLLSGGGTGGGITESVSQRRDLVRTASDSVASISETTTRTFGTARTVADAIASITESVSRIAGKLAAAADTLAASGGASLPLLLSNGTGTGGITETVATQNGVARSAADSVGDITESLGEDAVEIRGTADSLDAVVESVAREGTFLRATADSISAITEAVEAIHTPSWPNAYERTASDSVGAISEAITEPVAQGSVEPAPGLLHRTVIEPPQEVREPQRLIRSVHDDISHLVEFTDETHTPSDEWLVLDLPVLA
jgi:hypothetical protein